VLYDLIAGPRSAAEATAELGAVAV
jgi:hypothetical protein